MKKPKYIKSINTGWFLLFILLSCQNNNIIEVNEDLYFRIVEETTNTMVHDIISPPVASRIYVYPNIAAYEIIAQNNSKYNSLTHHIKDWKGIKNIAINSKINIKLSAIIAHLEMNKMMVFTEDKLIKLSDSLYQVWDSINTSQFVNSKKYALKVVSEVKKWMDKDNYNQTRTMPKFTIDLGKKERWQPTPPAYMSGIEPHWNKIRTLVLEKADQFKPQPPPTFSLDKKSNFYKELEEVYHISKIITKKGDTSEEVEIAQFWDCNPYVSVTRGHLMFATKKISPGAHWIGITKIACKKTKANLMKSIYANTLVSIGLFDGFISCWDEKYRSNLVRPETLINQHIDENWMPILQTPPFPEYTSGHSVISTTAAVILTKVFGEKFQFDDTTEIGYGLPIRSFNSFLVASNEAALSRLYGGIHYRQAIEVGVEQGKEVGNYLIKKLPITHLH